MKISEFAYISSLFARDLQHIIIHAAGEFFDTIQNDAETLYTFVEQTSTYYGKIAVANGEGVKAFSLAKQVIDDSVWIPETKEVYGIGEYYEFLKNKGKDYIDAIEMTQQENSGGCDLSQIMEYWKYTIFYKNAARSIKTSNVSEIEQKKDIELNSDIITNNNCSYAEKLLNKESEDSEDKKEFKKDINELMSNYNKSKNNELTDIQGTMDYIKSLGIVIPQK